MALRAGPELRQPTHPLLAEALLCQLAESVVPVELGQPLAETLRLAAREQADYLRRPERLRDGRLDRLPMAHSAVTGWSLCTVPTP